MTVANHDIHLLIRCIQQLIFVKQIIYHTRTPTDVTLDGNGHRAIDNPPDNFALEHIPDIG